MQTQTIFEMNNSSGTQGVPFEGISRSRPDSTQAIVPSVEEYLGWKSFVIDFYNYSEIEINPEKIFDTVTPAVYEFLYSFPNMFLPIIDIGNRLTVSLMNKHVLEYATVLDSPHDPELPKWRTMKINVYVRNLEYEQILELWDDVSEELYSDIDPEIAKNVFLAFESV